MSNALRAAARFVLPGRPLAATREERGHIHDTFVVTCAGGGRAVLQRLNTSVFTDPAALMDNVARVAAHLRARATAGRRPHALLDADTGHAYLVDPAGFWWRAWEYVEDTRVADRIGSPGEAREVAGAFGAFAADLADLPGTRPTEVIPRFHDLARRVAALAAAATADPVGRAAGVAAELSLARLLAERVDAVLAGRVERLPRRVVHNDAKIDNVLFDTRTGEAVCVIDLDTTMPGTVLADFGELVRSGATRAPEDEVDLDAIALDLDLYTGLADGYLRGAGPLLTGAELELLAAAGPWLAVENAVRFLTDHLSGDVYYRVEREDHNLHRARAQLRLASMMLERVTDLHDVIRNLTEGPP